MKKKKLIRKYNALVLENVFLRTELKRLLEEKYGKTEVLFPKNFTECKR